MGFRSLDTLVDAHQSVTTKVFVDGERVYENLSTSADRPWRVYSITKSVVSLLIGIAEGEGLLSLDDPVAKYVPAWRAGPSAEVTIRHLITMTSGREWSMELDDEMVSIASDQTAFALGLGQSDSPGTVWRYDNLAAQVLEPVLTGACGDLLKFAQSRLFHPIACSDIMWQRDGAGNLLTYAGLTATAEQLGAIGQLMINRGKYGDVQVVPAEYVAQATSRGSAANSAYGYLWWSNSSGNFLDGGVAVGNAPEDSAKVGRLAPSVPADAFWALGWGSQLMAVVPSKKLVAVRLGRRPRYPDDFTIEKFTATVLDCVNW